MSYEVGSPGQVKWPNYKITFQSRHGYKVSGKVMKLSEYDELISAYKTYISDFWYRWPQVRSFLRPPHYKSVCKKSTPLYLLWRMHIWLEWYRIRQLWTIRVKICIAYPSKGHLRSPEVTNRHLPITVDQKEIETWDWCPYTSWPGESNDMQYDPFRSSRDLGLTWPEVKLWPWPFKVILYMVRRALTRQIRWYQIRCSTFKINDFIVEKPFWKILEFWPLATSIWTWAKKWLKWFRKDFSRAFEHCLSFFSTATRSRDHGGGRSNAPPPSRRWKIQRPSRARVNRLGGLSCSPRFFWNNSWTPARALLGGGAFERHPPQVFRG